MKILITGANGQLGRELIDFYKCDNVIEVMPVDRDEMDITVESSVFEIVSGFRPDVIINAAAYTNVDGCESDYDGAYDVNVRGARIIASAAEEIGAKIIHISTDFVFEGNKETPYFEYDQTLPLSVYGKTKLAGEVAVRNTCSRSFILRTSWLYGKYGSNFVKTMIKLGKERGRLSVVTDQVGTPTYAGDLVITIDNMIKSKAYGVYHFSNDGSCSWNGFAKKIFEILDMDVIVDDTTSDEFIRPAKRPSYSVLDKAMIKSEFSIEIPKWENSLRFFLTEQYNENL